MLSNRRILIGVTGGIALYKICEVIRLLKKAGAQVKVVLSKGAEKFVKPLLFSALSGEKTYTNDEFFQAEGAFPHIDLANWAEVILLIPATADFLSKLRCGQGDELLLALLLATKAPVYLFPSMNTKMYDHPATQENLKILKTFGYFIYEPTEGDLACGEIGKGRLPEPEEIFELIQAHFKEKDLLGKKVLITGGPTREYIDRVRYITNASSGKTAFLLTKEAYYRGAQVYLLWGHPTFSYLLPKLLTFFSIPYPQIIKTLTTQEMFDKSKELFPEVDIGIFAGAPCDFRPRESFPGKIKKTQGLTLELELTPDIAKELSKSKTHQITIGFALEEREKLKEYAFKKKKEKNLDFLIGNPLSALGEEASDYLILGPNFEKEFLNLSKEDLAKLVFELILSLF